MNRPSFLEVASSYELWKEYADTFGVDTLEWFNQTPLEEKLQILEDCFGEETP